MSAGTTVDYDLKTPADYQQLVDDIESLMASPAGVEQDAVVRLHARYEQAVKAINARLRDCDQLLKKGLRNEALERSEVEPKLLDLFVILDFPERDSWEDIVRQCGLIVPDLLVSVAAELNEAYATEKPLADLKYQVRLHALARSALPIRITLMRRLAKQDQNSSVWDDDLKVFEKARHNQLASEVHAATKAGNASTLTELQRELQSPDWSVAPSSGLVKQVTEALGALQRRQAREQLWALEPQLTAAFGSFDVLRGREIRKEWQAVAAIAALPPSDPLLQTVEPALQWLRDQDQLERETLAYQNAVDELAQAIASDAGKAVLQDRYQAVMSFGQGLPEELQQQLEQRLKQLDREQMRAFQLKLAAAALAVILIAAGIFLFISNSRFRSQLVAQQKALEQMLQEKDLKSAEQHLAKLEQEYPKIAATPEIQRIKDELKAALDADARRRDELKDHLDVARRDGIEQATYPSISKALEALDKADRLIVYSSEKNEVADVRRSVTEKQAELQKVVDDEFNDEFGKLEAMYEKLKIAPLDNFDELGALKSRASLMVQRTEVSSDVRARKNGLLTDFDLTIAKGRSMLNESGIIREMSSSIGDRLKFFNSMDRYITDFGGTKRQQDFSRVRTTESGMVIAFLDWAALLEKEFMSKDLTTLSPSAATMVRTSAEKLLKDHGTVQFSFIPQVQEAISFLSKTGSRYEGSDAMKKLLTLRSFKVYAVRARDDNKQYYMPSEPPPPDATASINHTYYTDTEFKTTKKFRLTTPDHDPKWNSPQKLFAMEATELLDKLRDQKGANWDQTFVDLLEKLYKYPDMDEILRVQLISATLSASGSGSTFLPKRLERVKQEIDRGNLSNTVNWVSPDDSDAAQERSKAKDILKRLGADLRDMKDLSDEIKQRLDSLKHPRFDVLYSWTGWLHRDQSDNWTCSFKGSPSASQPADLFVLVKPESEQISFVRIGRRQQGQVKFEDATYELVEGRPVFERKPNATSAKSAGN